MLGRRTSCRVDHGSEYDVELGRVREHYTGRVEVDTRTFAQRAEASAEFEVTWEQTAVLSRAEITLDAGPSSYDVVVVVSIAENGEPLASRRWQRSIPRDLG